MKCFRQDLLSVANLRLVVAVVCLGVLAGPISTETLSSPRPWAESIQNPHLAIFIG